MLTKQNDELLKGVLEKYFADFLRFLHSKADLLFDFNRKIDFLDKELLLLEPNRLRSKGKRVADMLAKVYLKDNQDKCMLIHTEIEGGSHAGFPFRLLQYNYRFMDKHQEPIETVVFFIGDKSQRKNTRYEQKGVFSKLRFSFHAYHIWYHSELELLQMDNIFALVVLACQKAYKEGKVSDMELGEDRLIIARALLRQKHSYQDMRPFLVFLKNFLYVSNEEINGRFDLILDELTEGGVKMEIIDIVKKHAMENGFRQGKRAGKKVGKIEGREEGREIGLEEGREIGLEEGREEARKEFFSFIHEMRNRGLTVEDIANITKLSIVEIESI